jgi:hypothetical protein
MGTLSDNHFGELFSQINVGAFERRRCDLARAAPTGIAQIELADAVVWPYTLPVDGSSAGGLVQVAIGDF